MTSFVNIKHSAQHHGADRIESAVDAAQLMRQDFSASPSVAALVFSAVTVAGLVVSYQVMDSVEEGHLLVMWMALWYVAFAALALFAGVARQAAQHLKASLDKWSRDLARSRADQRLWFMAEQDPRLMADLQSAVMREEVRVEAEKAAEASQYGDVRAIVAPARPVRSMKLGSNVLRAYQRNSI